MAGIEAPDGWLWLETPARKLRGQSVETWLEALIDRGYVRATYIMTSGTTARARVYVVPEDVERGLLQEMDTKHRLVLKRLLEQIDTSDEGWNGQPVQVPKRIDMTSGLERFSTPTHEIHYFDAEGARFFKKSTSYGESRRPVRYQLRQRNSRKKST